MSRALRTQQFRDKVYQNWHKKFWKFIEIYFYDEYSVWERVSYSPNITWDIIKENPPFFEW